jgi:phosphoenolpyruvate phosphomutase
MTLQYRILPNTRIGQLKSLLGCKKGIRVIEVHSGLSGIVASTVSCSTQEGEVAEFDGLWVSSLTCTASKGLPDVELNSMERRLETINEIITVTDKPVIVDGDTGGNAINFEYFCSRLELMGVSAVIIEDKQYPKRNSLSNAPHSLEDPEIFASKIQRGKKVLMSNEFMIFARLESLIAGRGIEDALARTKTYLLAGADGIMIHSKEETTDEVYSFLDKYASLSTKLGFRKPIVCVPTTYNAVTDKELFQYGVDIVIHANHLLRASHYAMQKICELILNRDRTLEAEEQCIPIQNLFDIVGFNDILTKDRFPC